jgi:2-dehydro-3-deoxyphosphogluconate aldolase/(4S)-4-hydroxy-2-oxoglutarate aldolase
MTGQPVIPVIVLDDAKDAVPLAKALVAGGLPAIEITLRTDAALESIRRVASEVPEALVGAGTILNADNSTRPWKPVRNSSSARG